MVQQLRQVKQHEQIALRERQRQQQQKQQQQQSATGPLDSYPDFFRLLLQVGKLRSNNNNKNNSNNENTVVSWEEIEESVDLEIGNDEKSATTSSPSDGISFLDPVSGRTALHVAVANDAERLNHIAAFHNRKTILMSDNAKTTTSTNGEIALQAAAAASRATRIRVIKKIIRAYPNAIKIRDRVKGYTPLAYAACAYCLEDPVVLDQAVVVDLLLDAAAAVAHNDGGKVDALQQHLILSQVPAPSLTNNNMHGLQLLRQQCQQLSYSPLCLHIMTVSFLMSSLATQPSFRVPAAANSTSMIETAPPLTPSLAVLDALAVHASRTTLEQALETLYKCNTLPLFTLLLDADSKARRNISQFGRQTASTVVLENTVTTATSTAATTTQNTTTTTLSTTGSWIWEWALCLFKWIHKRRTRRLKGSSIRRVPFQALHVAAQVTDCPTPFLLLALRAFPSQVRTADPATLNLPHHLVASWYIHGSNDSHDAAAAGSSHVLGGSSSNHRSAVRPAPTASFAASGTGWSNSSTHSVDGIGFPTVISNRFSATSNINSGSNISDNGSSQKQQLSQQQQQHLQSSSRSICRQTMALSSLTTEYPAALQSCNKSGKTPVDLLRMSRLAAVGRDIDDCDDDDGVDDFEGENGGEDTGKIDEFRETDVVDGSTSDGIGRRLGLLRMSSYSSHSSLDSCSVGSTHSARSYSRIPLPSAVAAAAAASNSNDAATNTTIRKLSMPNNNIGLVTVTTGSGATKRTKQRKPKFAISSTEGAGIGISSDVTTDASNNPTDPTIVPT